MKIGIYGGSFDPVHYGHVNVARTAVADLGLDRLVVVPAAVSPFKTDAGPGNGPWDRLEMVKAAFADVPNAVVDMREVERGGVSYAIDTVRSIVAETPGGAGANEFLFIVGEDSLDRLDEWRDIDELRRLCTFKAYPRTRESSSEIRRLFSENGVVLNDDARLVSVVRAGLARKNAYCPCRLPKLPEFFCPCDEFKGQLADPSFHGLCHCRLYRKP
ncbi:MAG: adenylyltransferase/cytidyltransferase family protein [Kiritimatiellae bacterium]|nr:adenylyltransferase/cytidyltransferase family protein [Kiritimatiellia bacterium]